MTTAYDPEFAAKFRARGARTAARLRRQLDPAKVAAYRARCQPKTVDAPSSFWHGATVISEYTAEQGVADGLLFDARQLDGPEGQRAEAGKIFRERFKGRPVYLTAALYRLIEKAVASPRWCNDWAGVCWDIVGMARGAVLQAHDQAVRNGTGSGNFTVIITGCGRRKYQHLTVTLDGNGLTFGIQGED